MNIISAGYLGPINPHELIVSRALKPFGVTVTGLNSKKLFPLLTATSNNPTAKIIHLHHLTPFWLSPLPVKSWLKTFRYLFELLILKSRGIKLVWTVHNKHNHERKQLWLNHLNTKVTAHIADHLIFHCQTGVTEISAQVPLIKTKPHSIIPHCNYLEYYPNKISTTQARKKLNLPTSAKVLLFFGTLRPYKGVDKLISTFKSLNLPNTHLVISGWAPPDQQTLLNSLINNHPHITTSYQHIKDEDVQIHFNAADAVVLPFQDILNSGSIMLAFSFGKLVIAPKIGCIKNVLSPKGGIPYHPHKPQALAHALTSFSKLSASQIQSKANHNLRFVQTQTPQKEAQLTQSVYQTLLTNSSTK